MSNARNLANLLTGGDTTIATGDVANDAVTAAKIDDDGTGCLLYTSPSPRDAHESRMPSSA